MQPSPPESAGKTVTFRLSCWFLALMAFAQLLTTGVAVALRLDRQPEERVVVREIVRYVPQETPAAAPEPAVDPVEAPLLSPSELDFAREGVTAVPELETPALPAPSPPPLVAPPIEDPVVERLVAEAREARVAEDMRKAIVKLQEAETLAPNEPALLYEAGLAYEVMGIHDRAAAYFQRVYEIGTSGAGSLYEAAARKISVGFSKPEDQRGRLSLGQIRVFDDQRVEDGDRVVVTIPIHGVSGPDLKPEDVQVQVNFFDQTENEEIHPAGPDSSTEIRWLSEPIDWEGHGEEVLQVVYRIPPEEESQAYLFGTRRYYGQVVELSYRGALIDSKAWPRHLAQKMNVRESRPLFTPDEMLPEDYNPENPLLPLPVR